MFELFLSKLIAVFFTFFSFCVAAQPLLVAAAADLAPLEAPLTRGYGAFGGGTLRFVFGSSGMLARQIENGAPYDLFLCANEQIVKDLAAHKHLIADSVTGYAAGRLGIWSARGTPPSLTALVDAKFRLIAIANPEHAPYGAAARGLLQRAGLWAQLQPKIMLAENVRQAYEYARTGNADVVITSWTLLCGEPGAKLLPGSAYPPIRQSGGVVTGTRNELKSRAFLRFLLSPAGQSILQAGGLFPPMAPGC
jgi:molybdate transport system substrate-binding protein